MPDGLARESTQSTPGWTRSLLYAAALVPFLPGASQFLQRGVPDLLFTGDGAALELGTLQAAHGVQWLGPYSRFGWHHPGPAFFYLALPFYEAFGHRGPALNLFAFVANIATTVAIVVAARRLRGRLFALAVAALLAVYMLVGVPFLLANEWNPIFPVLPLALLSFLAACVASGDMRVVPAFAFVASVIVQTHVGYTPEVLALSTVAVVARWGGASQVPLSRLQQMDRRLMGLTVGILALCWALPLYEAVTARPGNLQLLARFFVPKHWVEHSWREAIAIVVDQMAVMPLALARTVRVTVQSRWPVVFGLASAQVVVLVAALATAVRRRDRGLAVLAIIGIVQIAAAILAVRGIRGDIESYLVAWASLLGFMSCVVVAAWLVGILRRRLGGVSAAWTVGVAAAALLALAISLPVARSPVIRAPDLVAERLARDVETYLRSLPASPPVIRIASRGTWPTAVAVVLHLTKVGIPIFVEREWISVVGQAFALRGGEHPNLFFGDHSFGVQARNQSDLTFVAAAGDVYVYAGRM